MSGDPALGSTSRRPIRVAIVEDHPVVRDGTASLLATVEDLEVVGSAASLEEATAMLAGAEVDVVLLDIRLGAESGLALLERLPDDGPGRPAVVVVTAYDYPQYADAALRLGAAGFVLKTAPLAELVGAVRAAAAGGLAFAVRPAGAVRLTRREHDVVRLVAEGRSNDEIAADLGIAVKTVETHLGRLFERFGVGSRTALATRAVREGWLEAPPG